MGNKQLQTPIYPLCNNFHLPSSQFAMSEETQYDIPLNTASPEQVTYDESNIRTLEWNVHIRMRPGMYIGKLGDGTNSEDGIYVLLKEVMDNSIDEFMMGNGKQIDIQVCETTASVRDYGRGVPLGKVVDVASILNTGGKYDSKAFKKSVGLNGVGLKAVNALSSDFIICSYRDGQMVKAVFTGGELIECTEPVPTDEPNGTFVQFTPDNTIFQNYKFLDEFIIPMLKNYTYLNTGLTIMYNGQKYFSRGGLEDLLKEYMTNPPLYQPIRLTGEDIDVVITHANQYGEEYYSFVNGQHTTQGGTHLAAFKEAVARTLKDFFGKNFEYSDIRNGMVAAIAIKVQEPVFESQTKIKLGSKDMSKDGPSVNKFISDFLKKELDNYLHKNLDITDIILKRIQESERERKAMATVTKQSRERAKKLAIHNRKLLDCRVHLSDTKGDPEVKNATSIFITEGESASGTITKIRNVNTQAVFSLRGKPLNTFELPLVEVYKNEEFALLRAALNIEESIDDLRYNKVIIATDADVDGMHIRLLLLTYFLQFCPDLVKNGHVYILQTPLFRVRSKKIARKQGKNAKKGIPDDTYYCYTDEERITAIERLGVNAEITRFKGLGEISHEEFAEFIGPNMRADKVTLRKEDEPKQLLEFYMGKNTPVRQNFIIDNMVVEDDTEISYVSKKDLETNNF